MTKFELAKQNKNYYPKESRARRGFEEAACYCAPSRVFAFRGTKPAPPPSPSSPTPSSSLSSVAETPAPFAALASYSYDSWQPPSKITSEQRTNTGHRKENPDLKLPRLKTGVARAKQAPLQQDIRRYHIWKKVAPKATITATFRCETTDQSKTGSQFLQLNPPLLKDDPKRENQKAYPTSSNPTNLPLNRKGQKRQLYEAPQRPTPRRTKCADLARRRRPPRRKTPECGPFPAQNRPKKKPAREEKGRGSLHGHCTAATAASPPARVGA